MTNVCRPREVSHTLDGIGDGVRLQYCKASEQVYIECLSQHPIFVQSSIANLTHGWHPATVCLSSPTPPLSASVSLTVARFFALCVSRPPAARRLTLLLHCTAS